MDITDGMDKSWDHPWTTEEMREKRREWSLAGDAGLLKHLQQFSENLVSRANKTQEVVDSLTTQLNETAIFVDNLTNTSLALANTQFIESRVQKDDIDIGKHVETSIEESKDQDSVTADLIASVSESVKQGLNIMYEKYKEMEFVDSDSEEEDNKVVLSVVLGPNNPYQDRPLPDVIGSEKWKNSSKIGLESSSSSESEQVDEEEKSDSEDDGSAPYKDFSMNAAQKTNIAGSLPSLNESDYSKRNDITYMGSEKLDAVSQNNIDSVPESISPNENVSKMPLPNNVEPNFAEELAKRLGTVRQAQKPVVHDKSETSINRSKDELFATEENENGINEKSKAVFSGNKEFLSNLPTENSWKEKPIKSYKTNNIIPASIDVPPPINTVSTNPKSAIDDLFGDADSEDSDDIFSSKNTIKTVAKNKQPSNNNPVVQTGDTKKNHLDIPPAVTSNMVTSTPETNTNINNLFSDDEDSDLFGSSKNQQSAKKKPAGGIPVLRNILTSDVESKMANKISWAQSSESFGSNMPEDEKSNANNVPTLDQSRYNILNDNIQDSSVIARGDMENPGVVNESCYSSGISIQPPSVNNTEGSSINDFQPPMTSTRIKSEELYRERVASDSLFAARTRNSASATSNSANVQPQNESVENVSVQDDVFEDEDLFGPPPLPKADSKPAKSKVSSLFDDSDSGDDLFSTTSSGSRSQKSGDLLTVTDKIKPTQGKGLFEEEIDIFDNKDSPDVDIFGITPKPVAKEDRNVANKKLSHVPDDDLFASNIRDTIMKTDNDAEKEQNVIATKKISLFDNDDVEDGDLFAIKPTKTNNDYHIFNDDDDNDLFSVKKSADKKQESDKRLSKTIVGGTDMVDPKLPIEKNEKKNNDLLSGNGLFSGATGSHGLIFEDDDYDDLFSTKETNKKQIKADEPKLVSTDDTMVKEDTDKDAKLQDDSNVFTKSEDESVSSITSENMKQINDKEVLGDNPEERSIENSESEMKNSPPNSLDINVTAMPPSPEENQGAKRSVSGKIKNLMGKMGDLKMISPMDTPPLWRRSEEKTDEEDSTADRDSDDGGCVSTQGHSSPPSASEDSIAQKQSQISTISGESNAESAISFDEPAQVETLSTASKTRVRIQAKRRPQSRHARKSAIRQSGIDFDTVDTSENNSQDESQFNQSSSAYNKEATTVANISGVHIAATISDRLASSATDNIHRNNDANIFLTADDRSELGSISKESSMSANKNTLLSPSTDEEDLFDVPPDLPEDPQKEDTLFGRAPILSPVEQVVSEKPPIASKPLKDTHIKQIDNVEEEAINTTEKIEESNTLSESRIDSDVHDSMLRENNEEPKPENTNLKDESTEMIDPLRDHSHDPLKDPSQLFAFVTKTPSPEKGKNLLFSEDDSLFTSGTKKLVEEQTVKKPALDLFMDDTEGDLFSTTLAVKKPLKDTKINLFDEEDEDDSLFGPALKKSAPKSESKKKHAAQQPTKKTNLFDDVDNDTNIFSEQAQKSDAESIQEQSNKSDMFTSITEPVRTSHITDIFADQSSGDDDIFAKKPATKKITVTSKSLFPSDDDDEDDNIFGNKSTNESQTRSLESRSSAIKKAVTRDLKKTAKKIGQDPLSVLLDE